MGTLLLYLASLVVNLTVTVGFAPLTTTAKVHLDDAFTAGTVCLIWESGDDSATPGSDCWTVENSTQRTWLKTLKLRSGTYEVWVTETGQDDKGNGFKAASPIRRVEVY